MAASEHSYRAQHLGFEYGVNGANFEIPSVGFITIIGPNGAGKSTLIGILAGLRRGYRGSCMLDGREIRDWNRKDLARRVTFLPQSVNIEFPFTAEQVVFMGRTPHSSGWFDSPEDYAAVEHALRTTDTETCRTRDFRTLSGGERQRVILASALAQQPEILPLDEPATFLDLKHELAMRGLLADLARRGTLVVAVTHDLNFALNYSHHVIAMHQGRVAASGRPQEVLDPAFISEVFEVPARFEAGYLRYDGPMTGART
jgi:iron complex transport system ATP-binding protein